MLCIVSCRGFHPTSYFCFSLLAGERVLCFHGPLLYEAKVCFSAALCFVGEILTVKQTSANDWRRPVCFLVLQCVKINIKDKQIKYFIHYSGWNKKWAPWFNYLSYFQPDCSHQMPYFAALVVMESHWFGCVSFAAGMNGFLKAEFSNMWTATLQNKKNFKRLISKFPQLWWR